MYHPDHAHSPVDWPWYQGPPHAHKYTSSCWCTTGQHTREGEGGGGGGGGGEKLTTVIPLNTNTVWI